MPAAFAVFLALLTVFCAAFKGAYDLWASLALTLAVLAALSVLLVRSAWREEPIPLSPWIPAGIAGAGLAASLASPVIPFESWSIFPAWAASLIVFPLAVYAFEREEGFELFLRGLVPFFCVQAILVFKEQIGGGFIDQSPGLLYDANASAAFHVAWIPVFADRAFRPGRTAYWKVGLIAAVAGFAGAQSVWGWVALAAALPWLFPDLLGRKEKAVVVLLVLGAAVWKFSGSSDRFGWWATGLRMFAGHPLTGVGPGGYSGAFLAYRVGEGIHTVSPHSVIVQLLSETGMIGVGAVCWAIALLSRGGRAALAVRRGPALGAGALLLFSLVSVCFEIPVNLLSLSILAGAVCAGGRVSRVIPRKAVALAAAALSVALFPFLASPLQASRAVAAGQAALQTGDFEGAAALFDNAVALDARSFEARRWAARAAFEAEGAEEAIELQREAVALNPLNGVLWMELSRYLAESHRDEEARAAARRAKLVSAGLASFPR